jgi:hypothetical protein
MRRIVFSLVLATGMVMAATVSASAHTFCSVDPTLKLGVPGVKLTVNLNLLGSNVYASSSGSSTTWEVSLGTPNL